MFANPEFQRNVWLELSQHRLLGMPAVLGAIFFLVYLIAEPTFSGPINSTAMLLYFALTLLWGTRLAGDALVNEIRDRTWDQQRMTSITPWAMAWGKLLGSTVYTWYGAIICLAVYGTTAILLQYNDVTKNLLTMLAIGVLAHSVALLASLQSINKNREYNRSATNSYMILGILTAAPFYSLALQGQGLLSWYGERYQSKDFYLISLLLICAWVIIAIYRKMREELQFRSYPFVWLAFLAFFTLAIAGIVDNAMIDNSQIYTLRLFIAFGTLLTLTYVMVLTENKDPLIIRRLFVALSDRKWRSFFELTPLWLVTLLTTYILAPFLILAGYSQFDTLNISRDWTLEFKAALIAATVFLSRDVLIILFFNFAKERKRADLTALMYLALLYWLLPSIVGAMGLIELLPIFFPIGSSNSTLSIISGLLQTALMFILIVRRYRKL
ncbi:MAG: hypothetical protein ACC707_09960 [Thiohalomonadales bacterium]